MKRQYDPSLLQTNSFNKVGPAHTCNDIYKREFVAKWISHLPLPMHRVEKCPRTKEVDKTILQFPKIDGHDNDANDQCYQKWKFKSVIYGMKAENLGPEDKQHGSVNLCNNTLDSNLLRIDSVKGKDMDSESSWKSIELDHGLQVYNLVEYPKDTVVFGETFKEFPVERAVEHGVSFKITILEIMTPFHFWFIITDKMRKSLLNVLRQMKQVYDAMAAEELKMAYTHIFPHQICAVPTRLGWARGIVISYLFGSKVEIFLVDFGMKVMLSPKVVKYLKVEFLNIPRQVIRGSLARIKPKGRQPLPNAAKKLLYGLILKDSVDAKIVQIKTLGEKKIMNLEIYKRRSEISITKLLVEKGIAEYAGQYAAKT